VRADASPLPADTIAALATAPGRAALAVVRLSGPDAHAVAARVVSPWPTPARVATLCVARHPDTGEVVDRPLVVRYDAGRSYTGEPSVELSTHGGWAVPAAVLDALLAAGAREALPGEFTRRAVLNGRLDLVQAEAVGDLIDARTDAMRRTAVRQLDGALSRRLAALRERCLEIEALVAYDIDFPEEDDGPVPRARVEAALAGARGEISTLLATAPAGELVREGAVVVLAGPPNAGKSSLFNALLGERRAIVTDVPGTTRDAIEAVVEAGGWPLRLVDTAGLRETEDVVERIGVETSEAWLARAHVVLACGEGGARLADAVARARRATEAPVLAVRTKADLVTDGEEMPEGALAASAATGAGLAALLAAAADALRARYGAPSGETPLLTRARHRRALESAADELARFRAAWLDEGVPATVAAVHLRAAVHALEELIGAVDVEDVLGRVFASFCVGK